MSKDVNLNLPLNASMSVSQLCEVLMKDFEKTGLDAAEFDIPGTNGTRQFLLNFNIRLITVDKRKH